MWNKITGKSAEPDSRSATGSSRRKGETSSQSKRTSESAETSKKKSRTKDDRDIDDDRVRKLSTRANTLPIAETESVASSYATAPSKRDDKPKRSATLDDDHPYFYESSRRSAGKNGDSSTKERFSRDSERDPTRSADRSYRSDRAGEPPIVDDSDADDPHAAHQFPGQVPVDYSTPYRPPLASSEGGPGLAAEYYGDQGESVYGQPGMHPEVLINSQPHLMPALSESKPPEETGHGAADDYFNASGNASLEASVNTSHPLSGTSQSKPPRPGSYTQSSGSGGIPTAAAIAGAAGAAVVGYSMSHQNSSQSHQQSSQSVTSQAQYSNGNGRPQSTQNLNDSQPPEHHSSHLGSYALGAAGVAAGAYALHNQHSHQNNPSQSISQPNIHASAPYSPPSSALGMRHRQEHQGPVDSFVEWWKDYEDVRKMEMYTEAIGVCAHCFDPNSSSLDAPRKHHYSRRNNRSTESLRRSGEHRRNGRVDKESRYYGGQTSDVEKKRGSKTSLIAAGVAGYGLAKAAEGISRRHDEHETRSSSSRKKYERSRRSTSGDRRSSTSRGVIRESDTYDVITEDPRKEGSFRVERHTRHRSGSRGSSGSDHRMAKTALGAAAGIAAASALSSNGKKKHRRSSSPDREHSGHRRRGSSPRESKERLTIYRQSNSSRGSIERRSSHKGLATGIGAGIGAGLLGGWLGSSSKHKSSSKSKKRRGLFSFSNGSSSSSDGVGLAYGVDIRRDSRKRKEGHEKRRKSKKSDEEGLNAAVAGLVATGAALQAAKAGRSSRHSLTKHSSRPELVAIRHSKDHHDSHRKSHTGADEEGWVDTDDETRMSVDSDLAFGDFNYKGKGRKSTDSLASNGSGTWNWWRWPRRPKKQRQDSTENLAEQASSMITPGAVAAIAGTAGVVAAGVAMNNAHREKTSGSAAGIQAVYPIATADPHAFDAGPGSDPSRPLWTSRPETLPPIVAPQPVLPVGGAMYAEPSQNDFVTPSGPPVNFSAEGKQSRRDEWVFDGSTREKRHYRRSSSTTKHAESDSDRGKRRLHRSSGDHKRAESDSDVERQHLHRLERRNTSPLLDGHGHVAAVASMAAAAAATAGVVAATKRSRRASSPVNSVRFDLDEDKEKKKERERDRDSRDRRRERETREQEATADRARKQRLEAEAATAAAVAAAAALATKKESDRRERERRDKETQARQEAEDAKRREDMRREDERMERITREREQKDRERRETKEVREPERRSRRRDEEVQDPRREDHSEDHSSGMKTAVEAAAAGAAVAAVVGAIASRSKGKENDNIREVRPEEPPTPVMESKPVIREHEPVVREPQPVIKEHEPVVKEHEILSYFTSETKPEFAEFVPSGVIVDTFEEEFDPNYFKRKNEQRRVARKAATVISSTKEESAEDVYNDLEQRYETKTVDAATFFAPTELRDKNRDQSPSRNPNADVQIAVYHEGDPLETATREPAEKPYLEDSKGYIAPWPVPKLKLIEPTPPPSRSASALGFHPDGKREVASQEKEQEPAKEEKNGSTVGKAATAAAGVAAGASVAAAVEHIIQSRKEEENTTSQPHSTYETREVVPASFEEEHRGRSNERDLPEYTSSSVYQAATDDAVSDRGSAIGGQKVVTPARRGYAEQVVESPPTVERKMPGGFDEDDEEEQKPLKNREESKHVSVYDYLDKDQDDTPEILPNKINGSRPVEDPDGDDYEEEFMSGALPDKDDSSKSRRKDKEVRISEDAPYRETDDLEQSVTSSAFTDVTARTSKSEGYADGAESRKSKSSRRSRDEEDDIRSEPSGRSSRKNKDRDEPPPEDEPDRDRERSGKKEKRRSRRDKDDDTMSVVSSASSKKEKDKDKKKEKGSGLSGMFSRSKSDLTESSSTKSKSKSDYAEDDDRERRKRKKERDRDRGPAGSDDEEEHEKRPSNRDGDRDEDSNRRRRQSDEEVDDSRRESKSKRESRSDRSEKRKSRNAEDQSFLGKRAEEGSEDHVSERGSSAPLPVTTLVLGGMAAAAAVGGVGAIMHQREKEKEEDMERDGGYDDRDAKTLTLEERRDHIPIADVPPSRELDAPEYMPAETSSGLDDSRLNRDFQGMSSRELDLSSKYPLRETTSRQHVLPDVQWEEQVAQIKEPAAKENIFEEYPELPDSRPSSPIEVGSIYDLPELPPSRPDSPYEEAPKTPPRPSLESLRAASRTAVPFRLPGRPPASPIKPTGDSLETPPSARSFGHKKSRSTDFRFAGNKPVPLALVESLKSPSSSDQGSPLSPFGRRYSFDPAVRRQSADSSPTIRGMQTAQRESAIRSRTGSTDRRTMLEQRPMWLVSKYGHSHSPLADIEGLPPLPPSREGSRSPSSTERVQLTEEQISDPFGPAAITAEPESYPDTRRPREMEMLPTSPDSRPSLTHEEPHEGISRILDTDPAERHTPSAHGIEKAALVSGVGAAALLGASKLSKHLDQPEDESKHSQLERVSEDTVPQSDTKEVSETTEPADPLLMRSVSKSGKRSKKPKKNKAFQDFDSAEPENEMSTDIDSASAKIIEPSLIAEELEQREDPLLTRTPSKSGKKAKKKNKRPSTIDSFTREVDEPQDLSAESPRVLSTEGDDPRALPIEDEGPMVLSTEEVAIPKSIENSGTEADPVSHGDVASTLLQRSKSKGKKVKKKKNKGGWSSEEPSGASTPIAEIDESALETREVEEIRPLDDGDREFERELGTPTMVEALPVDEEKPKPGKKVKKKKRPQMDPWDEEGAVEPPVSSNREEDSIVESSTTEILKTDQFISESSVIGKKKKKGTKGQKEPELPEEETTMVEQEPEQMLLVGKARKKNKKNPKFVPFDEEANEEKALDEEPQIMDSIPETEDAGHNQLHDDTFSTQAISQPRGFLPEHAMDLDDISRERSFDVNKATVDTELSTREDDFVLPENIQLPATDDADLIEPEFFESEHHHKSEEEQAGQPHQSVLSEDDDFTREASERRRASTSTAAEVAAMLRGDQEQHENKALPEVTEELAQSRDLGEGSSGPKQISERSIDIDEQTLGRSIGDANPDEEFAILSKNSKKNKRKEKRAKKNKSAVNEPESEQEVIATEPTDESPYPKLSEDNRQQGVTRDIEDDEEPEPYVPKLSKKDKEEAKRLEAVEENTSEDPTSIKEVDSSALVPRTSQVEEDEDEYAVKSSKKEKKSKKKAAAAAAAALVIESTRNPNESEEVIAEKDEPEEFTMTPSKKKKKNAKKAAKAIKKNDVFTSADDTELSTPAEPAEEQNRRGLEADILKPATADVELAAASAAALHESGFDAAMVLDDPVFSRPSSRARGLEEPDFDDFPQHASRKGSRRGSRRQSRAQSVDRGVEGHENVHPSGHGPIDDNEFAAVLAAGLHQAGFNPDSHIDDKNDGKAQDTTDNDLLEISAMRHSPKSGWGRGRNVKRRSEEALADQGGNSEKEDAVMREVGSRELLKDEVTIEPGERSAIPVTKKKEKRKKKGKGTASKQVDVEQELSTPKDVEHEGSSKKDVAIGVGAALAAAGATVVASHLIKSDNIENKEFEKGDESAFEHRHLDSTIDEESHSLEPSEGTKRSIPSGFDDSKSPPKKVARTSESDLRSMDAELTEAEGSGSNLLPVNEVRKQVSVQELNEGTWSFPVNRDSAILVEESPSLPSVSPKYRDIRDSGFQEPPFTPNVGELTSKVESHTDSPKSRRTSRSHPRSPIQVQVEVPDDWDVTVSQEQEPPREDSLRRDRAPSDALLPSTHQKSRKSLASIVQEAQLPPEIESTSKDRANALLFQSSPSSRDAPTFANDHEHDPEMTRHMSLEKSSGRGPFTAHTQKTSLNQRSVSGPVQGLRISGAGSSPRSMSPSRMVPGDDHTPRRYHSIRHKASRDNIRSASTASNGSAGSIGRIRSPDLGRPMSATSNRSEHSLRRVHSRRSGDLRSVSHMSREKNSPTPSFTPALAVAGSIAAGAVIATMADNRSRSTDMEGIYEGVGDLPASPMSPRPQSLRKRQSTHILDLQSRVEQLQSDNRSLHDARSQAEQAALDAAGARDAHANTIRNAEQAVAQRDVHISEKEEDIRELRETVGTLQNEVDRLAQENAQLTEENHGIATSAQEYTNLKTEHDTTHKRWQDALIAIAALEVQHKHMNDKMESMVREEIDKATADQEREIERLQSELDASMEQVKALQQQLLASKQANESFLTTRDEDYFDSTCQQLCQHVQQWVVRFSKFSDNKLCRLSSEIKDDTIVNRLDDAILDGSDVDDLLRDRVKRRDVFMSIIMSLLWEHIFTRYLFGLDQSQRQKLKAVEKQLVEIGPQQAVAQWRAITLTLLSRREAFQQQRSTDTEAVVQEIYRILRKLLSPPKHLEDQIIQSLRKVTNMAVDLALEMRTQKPEYVMLPPLRSEYDTNGDLVAKVPFSASLMNERSGEYTSNEELEDRQATVKMVLFPLVVKKGDDNGAGEEEIVVCPAQVLIAKGKGKKVGFDSSMDEDPRESIASFAPEESIAPEGMI